MASIESIVLGSVGHLQSFAIVSACFCGVIIWDLVYCLGAEIEYIYINEVHYCFQKRRWPSLPNVLLLNARLLTIPIVGLYLAVISPSSISAERKVLLFKIMWYLLAPSFANAIAIFIIRTIAIRSSKLPMKLFLWTFGAGIVAFFIYQVAQQNYSPSYFSYLPHTPTAQEISQMNNVWLHWAITASLIVALDVTIFALSFATRLDGGEWVTIQSRIGQVFFEDAIMYFFLTSSVSILDLVWICLHRHEGVYMAIVLPVQVWLALSISPRVLRNLKLEAAKEQYSSRGNISLQLLSKSYRHTQTRDQAAAPPSFRPSRQQDKSDGILFRHSVWIEESPPVVERSPASDDLI